MTASLDFYADGFKINPGSGLGFYGDSGFGYTIPVGEWNGRTFITNSNGTLDGGEVNNIKYSNNSSGIVGQAGSGIALPAIPNYLSTVEVRFTNDTAVQTQNVQLRIYDRSSIANPASGVTTAVAELIHPNVSQVNDGSGDTAWEFPAGTSYMTLAPSPGVSGLYAGNGSDSVHTDTVHSNFVAISASPDTIGSKTLYGLYVQLDYL